MSPTAVAGTWAAAKPRTDTAPPRVHPDGGWQIQGQPVLPPDSRAGDGDTLPLPIAVAIARIPTDSPPERGIPPTPFIPHRRSAGIPLLEQDQSVAADRE